MALRIVPLAGFLHRHREVVWPDYERVDARHLENLVEPARGVDVLQLQDDDRAGIAVCGAFFR